MKTLLRSTLITLTLATLLTGCKIDDFLLRRNSTPIVTVVPAHTTNIVRTIPQAARVTEITAPDGSITRATNQPPPLYVTNTFVIPAQTVTNEVFDFEVNPTVITALDRARALNSALNPTPSAPLITWGLGLLSAGLSLFAGWKTRSANKSSGALASVIKAVELFQSPEAVKLKEHIETIATLDGTEDHLSKRVAQVTAA
jgi:hypothetical protein